MTVMAPVEDAVVAPQQVCRSREQRLSGLDAVAIAPVLAALPGLATWPAAKRDCRRLSLNTERMLDWIQPLTGDGWQARWQRAEDLHGSMWREWPVETSGAVRGELTRGLGCLIKVRLVKPSYAFLTTYNPNSLFRETNGWHGDAEGLTVSLNAAENKLVSLDRVAQRLSGPTALGIPSLRNKG